jgi:phosphatidylethanolamine/phosphatidyl-N-methylethanolamine N-methyltransferase
VSNRSKLQEYRTFVAQALRQPSRVGAVLPTSRHVAAAMADIVPVSGTPTVLELGPGTGALSEAIRHRLPEGGRQLAVEIDPAMVHYLRAAKPWLHVVEGDAADLRGALDSVGITQVDAVITSLPWTLLSPQKQRHLLEEIGKVLHAHGAFTAITYLTAMLRPSSAGLFANALQDTFDEVLPRSLIWRNAPPARIYVCRRPVMAALPALD